MNVKNTKTTGRQVIKYKKLLNLLLGNNNPIKVIIINVTRKLITEMKNFFNM